MAGRRLFPPFVYGENRTLIQLLSGKGVKLLLAMEDTPFLQAVHNYFVSLGYIIRQTQTGTAAWEQICSSIFDALLIDSELPGMNGMILCRKVREEKRQNTPIVLFMGESRVEQRVMALNLGADVISSDTVNLIDLEAQIRALVRRTIVRNPEDSFSWADIELSVSNHTVTCCGQPLNMPPIPFAILTLLMRQAPSVVPRQVLEREIYGNALPNSDSLRTHIHTLRTLLCNAGRPILKTVPRVGFCLENWNNIAG